MKEQLLQKSILDLLRLKKYFAVKINTVGIYIRKSDRYIPNPNKGCPDILAWKDGKCIGVECKNKGEQSQEQKEWQENFEKVGGVYILARSINDVDKNL